MNTITPHPSEKLAMNKMGVTWYTITQNCRALRVVIVILVCVNATASGLIVKATPLQRFTMSPSVVNSLLDTLRLLL
jgi:hypothetical protein